MTRLAFAPRSCGSLMTEVAGVPVAMRPSGALWLEELATLIVADLHLEKGSSYAMRGQMLPPYDTRDTLGRLTREAAACEARTVILLGDTFHDRTSEARLSDTDAESLTALARDHGLVWVIGNHDADGPRHLPGDVVDELELAGLILRHEPQSGSRRGEVAGAGGWRGWVGHGGGGRGDAFGAAAGLVRTGGVRCRVPRLALPPRLGRPRRAQGTQGRSGARSGGGLWCLGHRGIPLVS